MLQFVTFNTLLQRVLGAVLLMSLLAVWPAHGQSLQQAQHLRATKAYDQKNYLQAAKIWLDLASQDDADAQYNLGILYIQGNGVPRDVKQAEKWFGYAADNGHLRARFNLGHLLISDVDNKRRVQTALEHWRSAAEEGLAEAQFNYGRALYFGIGLPQSADDALEWIEKAAIQGLPEAQKMLGLLNQDGSVDATSSLPPINESYAVVNQDNAYLHTRFNSRAPIIESLPKGKMLRVVNQRGGWLQVQLPGGMFGWVAKRRGYAESGNFVAERQSVVIADPTGLQKASAVVDSDNAIARLASGTAVPLVSQLSNWWMVMLPSNVSAWIPQEKVDATVAQQATYQQRWQQQSDETLGVVRQLQKEAALSLSANKASIVDTLNAATDLVQPSFSQVVATQNISLNNSAAPLSIQQAPNFAPSLTSVEATYDLHRSTTLATTAGIADKALTNKQAIQPTTNTEVIAKQDGSAQSAAVTIAATTQQVLDSANDNRLTPSAIVATATVIPAAKTPKENLLREFPQTSSDLGSGLGSDSSSASGSDTGSSSSISSDQWLMAQNPAHWTIQLFSLRDADAAQREYALLGDDAQLFTTYVKGKPWYFVMQGAYSERQSALAQQKKLGKWARGSALRKIGILHKKRCAKRGLLDAKTQQDLSQFCQ